jgi:hypothetical protein
MTTTPEIPQDETPSSALPPLRHRPDQLPEPVKTTSLTGIRKLLLANTSTTLPDEAASVVTAGVVHPLHVRLLLENQSEGVSLVTTKRVNDGFVELIPTHTRYLDLDIIPEVLNSRWAHLRRNSLDADGGTPPPHLTTMIDADGNHRAVLVLKVADYDELTQLMRESFRRTVPDQAGTANDYSDSILAMGIKEPLLLIPTRIDYEDGSPSDWFLTSSDGNSRLVSAWKARTGGDIDAAATAFVDTVIGHVDAKSGKRVRVKPKLARDRVTSQVIQSNKGLVEETLTEATRRHGHTLTVPATVVIGAHDLNGNPLTDLVAARDDILATLHVDVTAWDTGAQAEQGMTRVLRRALTDDILTPEQHSVLTGAVTTKKMHDLLGFPAHPLWAVALNIQVVFSKATTTDMCRLLVEEFNIKIRTRNEYNKRIGTTALSAYRSGGASHAHALNAFGDGGVVTNQVWNTTWALTKGTDPIKVLDSILAKALNDDPDAIAELTVLGGVAALLTGFVSRDRGSLESLGEKPGKVPYRRTAYRMIELLASTAGGRRMLHSIAVWHVDSTKPAKLFVTETDAVKGVHDGQPVYDNAGAQESILNQWNLYWAASPSTAAERQAELAALSGGSTGKKSGDPEDVQLRRALTTSSEGALSAAEKLQKLAMAQGGEVFGTFEAMEVVKTHLAKARDLIIQHGPKGPAPSVLVELEELDEDEDADE